MATVAELEVSLGILEATVARLEARLGSTAGGMCSAQYPHPDRLVYQRGANTYSCDCGMLYRKDGVGGLLEVK